MRLDLRGSRRPSAARCARSRSASCRRRPASLSAARASPSTSRSALCIRCVAEWLRMRARARAAWSTCAATVSPTLSIAGHAARRDGRTRRPGSSACPRREQREAHAARRARRGRRPGRRTPRRTACVSSTTTAVARRLRAHAPRVPSSYSATTCASRRQRFVAVELAFSRRCIRRRSRQLELAGGARPLALLLHRRFEPRFIDA